MPLVHHAFPCSGAALRAGSASAEPDMARAYGDTTPFDGEGKHLEPSTTNRATVREKTAESADVTLRSRGPTHRRLTARRAQQSGRVFWRQGVHVTRFSCVFLCALWACVGCQSPEAPIAEDFPRNATMIVRPNVYQKWWTETASCSGLSALATLPTIYVASGEIVRLPSGREAAGFYFEQSNRILLASSVVRNSRVVRHEMLHALLRPTRGHPRASFLNRCAEWLDCSVTCAQEAGDAPAPLPAAQRVTVDSLEVSVSSSQTEISANADTAFWRVRITVRNPMNRDVQIQQASGAQGESRTFGFDLQGERQGQAFSYTYDDLSSYQFRAGETKSNIFDFSASDLDFGRNEIVGSFATKRSANLVQIFRRD